jgi:hypothetical protein
MNLQAKGYAHYALGLCFDRQQVRTGNHGELTGFAAAEQEEGSRMPSTTDRGRALARIPALAAKTTDNGCTEAEAQTAVASLNRLMEAYEITLDEATVRGTEIVERVIPSKRSSLASRAVWGISEFTSTDFVFASNDVHVFGRASNTEIAEYLFLLCDRAIRRETFALSVEVSVEDRRTFGLGMAHRLSNRLADMAKARAQEVHSVIGTDLVVLGRTAAIAAVRERCGELTPIDRDDHLERRRNTDIYRVGWDAAGGVPINEALKIDHRPCAQLKDAARRQQEAGENNLRKAEQILAERRRKTEAQETKGQTGVEAEERKTGSEAAERRLREETEAWLRRKEMARQEAAAQSKRFTRKIAAYALAIYAALT